MDADNSGTITVDELRRGLAKQGTKLSEAEVEQLMAAVSFHFHFSHTLAPESNPSRTRFGAEALNDMVANKIK